MGTRLEGKVALVTGAAGGIGLATADRFAREGAAVVMTDSQAEPLVREAARLADQGFRVRSLTVDVTQSQDVRRAVALAREEFGRCDILFANAGVGFVGEITDTSDDDWDRVMGVNAKGVFLCCREAIRQMLAQQPPGGSIVITGSISSLTGIPGQAPYAPSKGTHFSSLASLPSNTQRGASGSIASAPGPWTRPCSAGRWRARRTPRRSSRCSRTAIRWAGSEPRRRSPRLSFSWRRTRPALSPVRFFRSMAATRPDRNSIARRSLW